MNKEPKVIYESNKLRVVLGARTYHGADKVYTIEEATKDAMDVSTWTKLDTVRIGKGDHVDNAERKLLIELLERCEPVGHGVPGGKGVIA